MTTRQVGIIRALLVISIGRPPMCQPPADNGWLPLPATGRVAASGHPVSSPKVGLFRSEAAD